MKNGKGAKWMKLSFQGKKIDKVVVFRMFLFVFGIFLLALGVTTVIKASLGVPTWDVMHIGLANKTSLSIGRWVQIIGVVMVLMTSFLEKEKPKFGSIANIVLVGYFINLILAAELIPTFEGLMARALQLIVGIVLMGMGSGMYVSSKIGSGPRDGMTLYLSRKFSISVGLSRTVLEMIALTIGWMLGGPVALGTFVSVFLIGPIMQSSLAFWTHQIKRAALTA